MSKHTPGPWEAREGGQPHYSRIIAGNRHIATAWNDGRRDGAPVEGLDHEANARLIAAAPDLLVALKGMREWARRVKVRNPGMEVARACAAIAKAEGQS